MAAYDGSPGYRQYQRLERAIAEAKLQVPIAKKFPLRKAEEAHRRIEEGHVIGKIVLQVS
jgi:NADPH2:quinone reductase